jgi:serpin B
MQKTSISNNLFTFDLYQSMKETTGNIFFSPYSIYNALAIAYAGAKGDTARQIAKVLHFDLQDSSLHSSLQALQKDIERCNSENTQLRLSNALWGQKGWPFLPGFLNLIDTHYGDCFKKVDFAQAPIVSCKEINRWVSERTQYRINEVIGPGSINEQTTMIITNSIYFKASWYFIFDVNTTHNDNFYTLEDQKIAVPMMKTTSSNNYFRGKNYQAIEFDYRGLDLKMLVILPDKKKFTDIENSLDNDKFNSILESMKPISNIRLSMAKFKLEPNYLMGKYLRRLGMVNALNGNADFSVMTDIPGLFLTDVAHSSFINIDEYGTEASALTRSFLVGGLPEYRPKYIDVVINHPFIFLIRDILSGTVLFIGRILNPLIG